MRKNKKYKGIVLEKMQVILQNIEYKLVQNDMLAEGSKLKVKLTSSSELETVNDEYFKIIHNRKLLFDPNAMFNISITVSIKMYYDIEEMKDFKDKEDFKQYIQSSEADLEHLINGTNVGAGISLLMGNITNAFDANPMIVPPILDSE